MRAEIGEIIVVKGTVVGKEAANVIVAKTEATI